MSGLSGALVLISCVKSKLDRPAPARELYVSTFFRLARDFVEGAGADWRILSAEHGLVSPNSIVAPYERTLNRMGMAARRAWSSEVLRDLLPLAQRHRRVVILAGLRYREFLVEPLAREGIAVEIPMLGLRQGEQMAWLGRQ